MNKEKSENIQNNKLKLFIDKAKSDKVAIWMIVTIFSITLFFTLIDKSYANKSRDIFDLLSAPLASSLTTYVFYRIFIFLIFEPYLAILNKKNIVIIAIIWIFIVFTFWMSFSMIIGREKFIREMPINSATQTHERVKGFMVASLAKCATTTSKIVKPSSTQINCNNNWKDWFVGYFQKNGFKNSYIPNEPAVYSCTSGILGRTCLYVKDDVIHIKTNIGTESGQNKYLSDVVNMGK